MENLDKAEADLFRQMQQKNSAVEKELDDIIKNDPELRGLRFDELSLRDCNIL